MPKEWTLQPTCYYRKGRHVLVFYQMLKRGFFRLFPFYSRPSTAIRFNLLLVLFRMLHCSCFIKIYHNSSSVLCRFRESSTSWMATTFWSARKLNSWRYIYYLPANMNSLGCSFCLCRAESMKCPSIYMPRLYNQLFHFLILVALKDTISLLYFCVSFYYVSS